MFSDDACSFLSAVKITGANVLQKTSEKGKNFNLHVFVVNINPRRRNCLTIMLQDIQEGEHTGGIARQCLERIDQTVKLMRLNNHIVQNFEI